MTEKSPDHARDVVEIIKGAGPATGGLAIAAYGVWGGQYAAKFKPPLDDFASWACFIAIIIGLIIAVWRAVRHPKN
jgi:hypothetical protein